MDLKTPTKGYLHRLFNPVWCQVRLLAAETLLGWAASAAPRKSYLRLRVCQFLITIPGRDD
jgi:hypothetical protein